MSPKTALHKAAPGTSHAWLLRVWPWIVVAVLLVVLYGSTIQRHVLWSLVPQNMSDDVRIVNYHFWRFADPNLFTNDILGKYHSEGTSELYRASFFVATKLGFWHAYVKLMPHVLMLTCLVGLAVAANAIGGPSLAFFSMLMFLSASMMLGRMTGMLPRAFAYPILAWMAAALVTGRLRWLAILTVIGTGFYPVITVIGLLTFGCVMFLYPQADRGDAAPWSLKRRMGWVVATTIACAVLTLPFSLRMRPYGQTIGDDQVTAFPEAGPKGRQDSVTRPPHAPLPIAFRNVARATLAGSGRSILPIWRGYLANHNGLREGLRDGLLLLTLVGCAFFGLRRSVEMRRLAALVVATGVGYLVAKQVAPSLVVPQRYVLYAVPIIVVLTVPAGVLGLLPKSLWQQDSRANYRRQVIFTIVGICIAASFGGRGDPHAGLGRRVLPGDEALFAKITQLPSNVLIAGWPDGTMNNVPVMTHRTPFLSKELHVPYHTKMTLLMRQRMYALIDAYFATTPEPILRLRREFGVTHLVVEWEKLAMPPKYFAPFTERVIEAQSAGLATGFEARRQLEHCAIHRDEKHALLDLACVAGG